MELYVTGGRERKRLLKDEEEWKLYQAGLILRVNDQGGRPEVCVDYVSPEDARAGGDASVLFKASTVDRNRFYTCTSTEVMVYSLPQFKLENYISLPVFNDCHHVSLTPQGTLLVTSTGLDAVFEISTAGSVVRGWNALGNGDLWQRFSRAVDYRKVLTTKPHCAHPNFTFHLGEHFWTSRMVQRDAFCLTASVPPVRIGNGCGNHDGLVYGDRIYFTTVDGSIVIVDRASMQVAATVDLNTIDNPSAGVLGWCRGLYVVNSRLAWVGFTRVRKTKFMENLLWAKHGFADREKPTRIALYDMEARKCLTEVNLEPAGLNVLFGIYPMPDEGSLNG